LGKSSTFRSETHPSELSCDREGGTSKGVETI